MNKMCVTKIKSKGVVICREIASMEKKIVGDIEKIHCDEDNKDLVQLAADNAKLAFQGFQNAEEVVRNLFAEFNDKIYQI